MDPHIQNEVIGAYDRRGKGSYSGPFVDHTRNGRFLRIDRTTGSVQEITPEEYYASGLPKYDDGVSD